MTREKNQTIASLAYQERAAKRRVANEAKKRNEEKMEEKKNSNLSWIPWVLFGISIIVILILWNPLKIGTPATTAMTTETSTATPTLDAAAATVTNLENQLATLQAAASATPLPATETPVPTATTSSTAIIATSNNCGDKTLQTLYLTVVNPGVASQPQIGHPSAYAETHVSDVPVCVVIDVPEGYKAIIGGVAIDKLTGGVYQGYGPGHIEAVVTNGFALITTDEWSKAEWDFRIQQTVTYGWAHAHVDSGPIQ